MMSSNIPVGLLQPAERESLFPVAKLKELGLELRLLGTSEVHLALSEDADLRIVIIQQVRRRLYSRQVLENLRRRFPLAIFVVVNGRWIEGAARSGIPYPGVINVRDTEVIPRICRLVSSMRNTPKTVAEYRPTFSARESLNWWLAIGVSRKKLDAVGSVWVYGHRDSTGGIAEAFRNYGWHCNEFPFENLRALNGVGAETSKSSCYRIAVARNREEVRSLVRSNVGNEVALLVADNINTRERMQISDMLDCNVIGKPFQNDDLVEAMQVENAEPLIRVA